MGGFSILVELHRDGSAPAACAAGLFFFITSSLPSIKEGDVTLIHWWCLTHLISIQQQKIGEGVHLQGRVNLPPSLRHHEWSLLFWKTPWGHQPRRYILFLLSYHPAFVRSSLEGAEEVCQPEPEETCWQHGRGARDQGAGGGGTGVKHGIPVPLRWIRCETCWNCNCVQCWKVIWAVYIVWQWTWRLSDDNF